MPWSKSKSSKNNGQSNRKDSKKLFSEAGILLKERRESYGISRSNLAERTRITPSVIEAIENGWINKLPEAAYLCSMVSILEIELNLERNSLDGLLQSNIYNRKSSRSRTLPSRNIEIIRTWQGSLLYIFIILVSILGLNYQQRDLATKNSQTFTPIIPQLKAITKPKDNDTTIGPELTQKSYHLLPNWLTAFFSILAPKDNFQWLELKLDNQSELSIESRGEQMVYLDKVSGNLRFKLVKPFIVNIQPPPKTIDQVLWEGREYLPNDIKNGTYIFNDELNKPTAPSIDRPQNVPRSP